MTIPAKTETVAGWYKEVPFTIYNDRDLDRGILIDESIGITITGYQSTKTYQYTAYSEISIMSEDVAELPKEFLATDCECEDVQPFGPPVMSVTQSGGDSGFSENPVRYSDGTLLMRSMDVVSNAGSIPWSVTREWTNAPGFGQGSAFGSGTVISQQPYLVQIEPNETIALVRNGHSNSKKGTF